MSFLFTIVFALNCCLWHPSACYQYSSAIRSPNCIQSDASEKQAHRVTWLSTLTCCYDTLYPTWLGPVEHVFSLCVSKSSTTETRDMEGGWWWCRGGAKEAHFPLSTAELNENPAWPDIPHLCPPRFLIIATYSSHLSNLPHSPAHASQWQLLPPVMGSITLFTHAPPPHCCLFRELCSLPGVLILKFHPCLIFVRVHLRAHSEQRYSLVWFYCRRAGWPVSTLVFSSFKSDFVRLSVQLLSHVRLCDPMNHSTPGLPVHHQLPEFTQTHVHRVGDAI